MIIYDYTTTDSPQYTRNINNYIDDASVNFSKLLNSSVLITDNNINNSSISISKINTLQSSLDAKYNTISDNTLELIKLKPPNIEDNKILVYDNDEVGIKQKWAPLIDKYINSISFNKISSVTITNSHIVDGSIS